MNNNDTSDSIHYLKINIQRNKSHKLSFLANKKSIRSMPELIMNDGDDNIIIVNQPYNNCDKISQKEEEDEEDTSDDGEIDLDWKFTDSKFNGVSSVSTFSSIEEDDNFLPKIKTSKITSSIFM